MKRCVATQQNLDAWVENARELLDLMWHAVRELLLVWGYTLYVMRYGDCYEAWYSSVRGDIVKTLE